MRVADSLGWAIFVAGAGLGSRVLLQNDWVGCSAGPRAQMWAMAESACGVNANARVTGHFVTCVRGVRCARGGAGDGALF